MRQEVLRMEQVTYVEKGITRLENFSMQIYEGEIMGFMPASGHGLSAFLKLLLVNHPLHDGFIYYREELVNSWRESRKDNNRISIVYDKSCLVEGMTVAENIFVLRQGFRQRIIRRSLLRKQLEPFLEEIGMDISPDSYVEKLSYFERVVVEILRAVILGHRLIVLNEIGTRISETESKKLYLILRKYASQGIAFLYITLHFEEALQICDSMVLVSYGRVQKVIQKQEMVLDILLEYPEEFNDLVRGHMEKQKEGKIDTRKDIVLELKNITCEALQNISIKIGRGECLVVQSLDSIVYQSLTGLATGELLPERGDILLEGREISMGNNRDVAVIREQPNESMIFQGMSYIDNLCIGLFRRLSNSWQDDKVRKSIQLEYGPILGQEVFYSQVEDLTEQQKYALVYTRILLQKPKVVFCIQPFKGADISHRMFIWKMLEMLLEKGIAVVILAINLADSMSCADRLLRIDSKGLMIEMSRKEFPMLIGTVPWVHLYQKKEKMENNT